MLVVLNRSSPVNYCYRLDEGLQYRIIEKMIVFRKEVRLQPGENTLRRDKRGMRGSVANN